MKTKSCLSGATVLGILAGLTRVTQYILTIGKDGYYLPSILSSILNYTLVGLLVLGAAWILFCGFGGKKREVSFAPLYNRSPYAALCFWALGLLAFADGALRLLNAEVRMDYILAAICLAGGLGWILLERLALRGKCPGLLSILPALHLGAWLLDYFWTTHKYIHVSEYALVILTLCALLLFAFAIIKPAGGGASTGQRICATAGLVIIMTCAGFLPMGPAFYLQGMNRDAFFHNGLIFLTGLFYLILAILTLKRLSKLPPDPVAEEPASPDLSALESFLSDLPEVEDEEE